MEKLPLFAWQQRALTAARDRTSYGLFSDPGTGKTYCALRIAANWTDSAVVVLPSFSQVAVGQGRLPSRAVPEGVPLRAVAQCDLLQRDRALFAHRGLHLDP